MTLRIGIAIGTWEMTFFISSFVGEREQTQQVQAELRRLGHEISVDWTSFPGVPESERNERPHEVAAIAIRDLEGVRHADVFVLLAGVADGRAKYAELGAAIMSAVQNGKPRIYILGDQPVHSVFFFHPAVKRMNTLDEILKDIEASGCQTRTQS
jgi:hypothetical protein